MIHLPPKDPLEIIPLTFEVENSVSTIQSVAVTVTVHDGIDGSPSAILSGAPVINGTLAHQLIQGGLHGVGYKIKAVIDMDDGTRWADTFVLPVRNDA